MDFALELAKSIPTDQRAIVAIGGPPGAGKNNSSSRAIRRANSPQASCSLCTYGWMASI